MALSSKTTVRQEIRHLTDILNWLEKGTLRIPDFQRPFVWNDEAMRDLFDSILQGYPIGSLLFWEPNPEESKSIQSTDEVGPFRIAKPMSGKITYVLDGFQRLSTLFGVLQKKSPKNLQNTEDPWKWTIYYDLQNEELIHEKARNPQLPPGTIPLDSLVSTFDFIKEIRSLMEQFSENDARPLVKKAEEVASAISSYKIGITIIEGGDIDSAVDIFTKLNSKGRQVSTVHMLNALSKNELSGYIDRIKESLREYHFGDFEEKYILRSIIAGSGSKDIYLKAPDKFIRKNKNKLEQYADTTEKALQTAAQFCFQTLRIPGYSFLPYSLQLVFLAEFFRINGPQISPKRQGILERWFWSTSFTGWFGGVYSTKANKALEEMRQFAHGEISDFSYVNMDEPAIPLPEPFQMNSARAKAFVLFLLSLDPKDFRSGASIDAFSLMLSLRYDAISKIHLPTDPRSSVGRFLTLPASSSQLVNQILASAANPSVLASYALDSACLQALQHEDLEHFFHTRKNLLIQEEGKFLDSKGIPHPAYT